MMPNYFDFDVLSLYYLKPSCGLMQFI